MLPCIKLFRYLPKRNCIVRNKYSTKISDKPLGAKFFHPDVQFCMKNLVTVDYDYICRKRRLLNYICVPKYELLTDADLERLTTEAKNKAGKLLQFPPIIDVTSDKVEILSEDGSLDGHDKHHSKIAFIDLSQGFNKYERIIVVREPDGILRTANKNERFRMEQIFFPNNYREMEVPKMFQQKHLQEVLERKEYQFVLDRACMQFEPDEETFHKILIITYDTINENKDFDTLHKTRHFGSMAFYLAVNKKINNLLQYFIEKEEVIKAAYLIKLQQYVEKDLSDQNSTNLESSELTFDSAFKITMDFITDPKNRLMNLKLHLSHLKAEQQNEEILKSHGIINSE